MTTSFLAIPLSLVLSALVVQEPSLWTGSYSGAGGSGRVPVENLRGDLLPLVEEGLARVAVLCEVDRDFARAEQELLQAWLLANLSRNVEHRIEGLVRIAVARAELLLELGRLEEAREAAGALLLRPEHAAIAGLELVLEPAGAALVAAEREALADSRLESVRAAIGRRLAEPDDDLEAQVADAVATGNTELTSELGTRAIPALVKLMLALPDALPDTSQDAVYHLIGVAEIQAARTILEHIDSGGFLWRKRVLRAMGLHGVLSDDGTWADAAQRFDPPHCLEPEWLEILAALLLDPDVGRDCLPLVREAAIRDALTPGLQVALGAALVSDDADLVRETMETLDVDYFVETLGPVLERAAASPREHVRRFAADRLTLFPHSSALRGLASDTDPQVRASVGRSLRRLQYLEPGWTNGLYNHSQYGYTEPAADEAARAQLTLLVVDPDVSVRREAARSIAALADPLPRAVYESMLTDPDQDVRLQVLELDPAGVPSYGELLSRLARDTSPSIRSGVDKVVSDHAGTEDGAALIPALLIRAEASAEMATSGVMQNAVRTSAGLVAITPWALERDDVFVLGRIVNSFQTGAGFGSGRRNARLELLSDPLLAGLYVRSATLDANLFDVLQSACQAAEPAPYGAMRVVMADAEADLSTRLSAASVAARVGGETFSAAMLDLLSAPGGVARSLSEHERKRLGEIASDLPAATRNPLLLRVVRSRDIPDELATPLVAEYDRDEPLGRDIALAVLERWFAPGAPTSSAVRNAILHLGALPADADAEILRAAARHPAYTQAAVEALSLLRSPELLPVLGECLRAEWLRGLDRQLVQREAADAIKGYLSEEAAQLLLQGIGWAASDEVRGACFAGLTTIQEYVEEAQRWQDHAVELPTYDSAKRRLFEMLRSDEPLVRGEAAKGLAAFGALEALPDLIVLLTDSDAGVRASAQQALARLQQAP